MAKETKVNATKEVKETAKEIMKYKLEMPDGSVIEGSTQLRPFQPNVAKGFKNSGFQVGVTDGKYKGSIMLIDLDKQERI